MYHYEKCWQCGKKWRCTSSHPKDPIFRNCLSCEMNTLLRKVANTWCQLAEFCYDIGDVRAGPKGCIHVQARMLLDRMDGNPNPQPVCWNPAKQEILEEK